MVEIIRMPEILAGAEEAAVQSWLVTPGTSVVREQPIAEIETDKASVELTAEADGTIGRLLVADGDSVAVGDPLFILLGEGESDEDIDRALSVLGLGELPAEVASEISASSATESVESAAASQTVAPQTAASQPAADDAPDPGRRLIATPLVRRLAVQHAVSLADVRGTGPNGRIVRRDFEAHLAQRASEAASKTERPVATTAAAAAPIGVTAPPASASARPGWDDVPLDRMRKAIARRLTESKSTVPHFYLVADCRVDALMDLRAQVNRSAPRKISVNDLVVKAVATALMEVPQANAIWNGDSIRRFSSADVSVAVATAGGLTTPVVRGIEKMSLTQVSATIADLANRAREGRLKQAEIEGGSFSVSNLGMYDISQFSAILNPPQSGILAVGAARRIPLVDADGQLAVGQVMTVTLSADHRVLDGAVAAQWLAAFQRAVENPLAILI
ncbi:MULTISPECIES: dihydrolipoamide acetyltransferase family protein [Microbacterium]|jgi:pyruvate dehydrogenase E2 component (dihydrolipoamide acetyltransferase)|uniref:dihydrolipoamide acetyltransferase family protein n=1 Tax=Microbacterium TaxID=33882 RepID=UPI0023DB5D96|nr:MULTISPECIES: dihydrolipoamide acetyltransferase family protein [Microbacterium]MDF2046990.1 dihydrolipoamide acetyltransferase family protein [Microbacterium sp. Kw_RZR3]MDF2916081.1 pyruvate dehydrogenase complex dihydrolipoamide acetyltransferase [Microbacterium sp.]MDQ1075369.1 pyruvate dehydrogenase E2 component (dihydrolipoamide acetyltransferase) [Microbacterium sp. SORGH_AS_0969]MDQ1115600.1 pyruvate dehydrogenase E2 component (dihydrolipoamide acetyltransferase) [Microbacterium test